MVSSGKLHGDNNPLIIITTGILLIGLVAVNGQGKQARSKMGL
jgi:hypothetical protein